MPQVFNALDRFDQDGIDAVEVLPEVVVGDLEKLAFRIIQQVEHIGAVLIGIADDLAADADEFPLDEFLQDDPGMGLDIGGGDDGIGQLGDVIRPRRSFPAPA